MPIGLAGLGGLWSERAGVVNIGLEGMMILGTWGAGWAGYQWGPWAGVLVGIVVGALGGLLHAVATVTFGVDHIVSGVAINILGLGVTQYLSVDRLRGRARAAGESAVAAARRHRHGLAARACATRCSTLRAARTGSSSPTSPASLRGLFTERLAADRPRRPARGR